MITGDADLQSVTSGSTQIAQGLGLWADAIVDQHFLKRQRQNRLMSAVLDHPALVGVGIDEATAVVVRGTHIEVLGRSAAVVFDARRARVAPSAGGAPLGATDMSVHVLRAGMSWDLR
jgi:cyanophycinase